MTGQDQPQRDVEVLSEHSLREQKDGDDAHGLLSVVAAVPQRYIEADPSWSTRNT